MKEIDKIFVLTKSSSNRIVDQSNLCDIRSRLKDRMKQNKHSLLIYEFTCDSKGHRNYLNILLYKLYNIIYMVIEAL